MRADVVTVFSDDITYALHLQLFQSIYEKEPAGGLRLLGVDNRRINRGMAAGYNLGAFHPQAAAPVIAFLRPTTTVTGPFIDTVTAALDAPTAVAQGPTGLFVTRQWFTAVGGFDPLFVWAHEFDDLVRTAETSGAVTATVGVPLRDDTPPDPVALMRADRVYQRKWGSRAPL